jgi:DNA gyrase inhibitor GyrI
MIRSLLLIGLLFATACGTTGSAGRGGSIQPEARAILERALEDMGGDAAVARIESMRLHTEGVYKAGAMESPFTANVTIAWPDRIVWKLTTPMFNGAAGVDEGVAWAEFMAPAARCSGAMEENVQTWILHNEMMLIRPLLHRSDVTIRTTKVPGNLTVSFDGGKPYVMRFAMFDGKLRAYSIDAPSTLWDGRKGVMKMRLSEPRPFGSITLMAKNEMVTQVGDDPIETFSETLTDVEWNPEIAEDEFRMPAVDMEFDKPATQDMAAAKAVVMVHEGPYSEIGDTIRDAMSACMKAGLQTGGQIIAVYRTDPTTVEDEADLRTDIVIPVILMGPPPENLPAGITIRDVPGAKVVSMAVRGPYGSHEGESIPTVVAWAAENGLRPSGPPQVVFLHHPDNTLPADQIALVQIPVAAAE